MSKPKIIFVADVVGWAWWIKSHYLYRYLKNDFDISIAALDSKVLKINNKKVRYDPNCYSKYDLCITFGCSYVNRVNVPKQRLITGLTAHRTRDKWEPFMGKVSALHTNSLLLFRQAKKLKLHSNIYYVPNGVDETLFTPAPLCPDDRFVVGHVGKLTPKKGQKEYIEPSVAKAGVPYFSHYNNHKTRIPHKEVKELYKNFDLMMISSFEDATPNPGLEAAASGRPILSNRIGNMPEFIKDGYNGYIVPRNIDAYVEKINYMKSNLDKVREMGANARKEVELNWTWKKQSENYRKMIRGILKI